MSDRTLERSYGRVFDEFADEYDRHRPAYPDGLLDHVCELAALGAGDRVLEIGCGTGQLTRSLLARGLRVTALEPGHRLIALARENLGGMGDVEFVNARLEDAPSHARASTPCSRPRRFTGSIPTSAGGRLPRRSYLEGPSPSSST